MNLLFYRYGSICEPDIIEGFRELGNQVTEITLEIYNKNLGPLEGLTALKNELFAHSYDFVFSINYYPFISEICNIFQIRYLCWTVDCPVMELYSDTVSNPWNRIFLFDRAQYEEIAPQNPGCIFHLPGCFSNRHKVKFSFYRFSVFQCLFHCLIRQYFCDRFFYDFICFFS